MQDGEVRGSGKEDRARKKRRKQKAEEREEVWIALVDGLAHLLSLAKGHGESSIILRFPPLPQPSSSYAPSLLLLFPSLLLIKSPPPLTCRESGYSRHAGGLGESGAPSCCASGFDHLSKSLLSQSCDFWAHWIAWSLTKVSPLKLRPKKSRRLARVAGGGAGPRSPCQTCSFLHLVFGRGEAGAVQFLPAHNLIFARAFDS